MGHKTKKQQVAVSEAREHFVYVMLAMMLVAATTDWLSVFVTG
jgi:hypothetical protein